MTYFLSGQYNAICDRCGFKFKSNELKKDWQGLMVCSDDYEPRNQQDFIKVRTEKAIPDWARPRPEDIFLFENACTVQTMQGKTDIGGAGCWRIEFSSPY